MTLLARINARLDEIEAGPAVIAVAVFLAAAGAAFIFGNQTVLNLVLIVAVALVIWNYGLLHSRVDGASDDADKALSRSSDADLNSAMALARTEAVHDHLTGLEKPSTGKHSKGRAA